MNTSPFERQKKVKLIFAVLAVGIMVSALVGTLLFYMGRIHPRF